MSCILLITDPIRRNVLINLVIRFLFIWSSGFGLMTLSPHTEWSISESLAMAFVRYFQKREKLRNEGSQQDMPILKISSLFLQKKDKLSSVSLGRDSPSSTITVLSTGIVSLWKSAN